MNWISTKDKLPEEGKYVLARHNRGTWNDRDDQENVNCVVVKLKKGISKEERELMKSGKLESKTIKIIDCGGLWGGTSRSVPRHNITRAEDEEGNNLVPYNWSSFGVDSFFGQTITHWMPIEPLN
jgi:hypothetical protein